MNWESAQALLAIAAQTTTGAGAAVDLGARDRLLRQTLAVSAASGTSPTLDVRLEASADGLTGWRTFATFTRATVAAVEKITAISPERYVRVAWTIGGTDAPSFTFGVTGMRGVSYANLDDFDQHGVPSAALRSRTTTQKCEALAAASTKAEGKLQLRFDLPLVSWGRDLTEAVCKLAAYEEMSVRGFNPDGSDSHIRDRHNDAWKWLSEVADSRVDPVDIVDSTPDVADDGVVVVTTEARGWR